MQKTEDYIQKFASEGLRTLLIAQKEVTLEFYNQWSHQYQQAMLALSDRENKMNQIAELIEWEFELVGSTAIEDKLQDEVSEVIDHIRKADVKLWVLTGDKNETAINIGYSCNLLDNDMELFIIDKNSTKEIYKQLQKFNFISDKIGLSREKAVIVGGEQLAKILKPQRTKKMQDEFIKLTDSCATVLCCRVSPKQKALIVKLVQEYKPKITTLAIGDGANDVNMINAASIGIGISGLEGQQASRASDFSIGQFRFLKQLMFVHGRECYRRNSLLVIYMFYKNIIYVLPIWWFGMLSLYSGTQIYNIWLYNAYNVVFTGLPICWYCAFDWQYPKRRLLRDPLLYRIGLENRCFNSFQFWKSAAMAVWQSFILLILPFQTMDESGGISYTSKDNVLQEKSTSGSLILNGVFIFQAIVWLINVKIFVLSNTHSCLSILWQISSVIAFYVMYFYLSTYSATSDLYMTMEVLLSFQNQYILLFLFATSYILIEHGIQQFEKQIEANLQEMQYYQQLEMQEQVLESKLQRQVKYTKYKRKSNFLAFSPHLSINILTFFQSYRHRFRLRWRGRPRQDHHRQPRQ